MDKTHLSSYVNLFENVLTLPRVAATSTTTTTTTTKKLTNSPIDDESFCQICYRDLGGKSKDVACNAPVMLKLQECGHVFCIECWSFHFQSMLSSAASASAFECMQTKCKSIADKEFVLKCFEFGAGNDQAAYKYRVLLAKDLVKESEDLQICPGEKDESESESSLVKNYTGTPQMTATPRIGTAANSNIRLISTISSTPTISFSYVTKPNGTRTTTTTTTTTSATPSTPQFSSITSTPTLTNTPLRPQGIFFSHKLC